jgi:hypothetical protein
MSNPLSTLFTWIRANKLSSFLLAIVAYGLIKTWTGHGVMPLPAPAFPTGMAQDTVMMDSAPMVKMAAPSAMGGAVNPVMNYSAGAVNERITTQTTSLALKVKNVGGVANQIETLAKTQGGWLVDSSVEAADSGSTNGTISFRVPTEKLPETLDQVRGLGLRVVSEHVMGTDITDQYQNVTAQLEILEQTKQKLVTILASATKVQDMLEAQQQLLNMQQQIDSLQGQQKYLDQSAKLSLVTVYLATDELALPVTAPGEAWRPNLVFKEALRSLVGFVYRIGNAVIWVAVFAPIWLPVILVYQWWQKRQAKR